MKVTREVAQTSLENIRKKGYVIGALDLNDTFDWNIVVTYINDLSTPLDSEVEEELQVISSIVESWLTIINEDLDEESAFVNVKINMGTMQRIKQALSDKDKLIDKQNFEISRLSFNSGVMKSKLDKIEKLYNSWFLDELTSKECLNRIKQILKED